MKPISLLSAAEQVADYLRTEINRGALSGNLPGIHQLANELAVNHKTIVAALQLLEEEGLLESQGKGRCRRITKSDGQGSKVFRVALLMYDPEAFHLEYIVDLIHLLTEAGHTPVIPSKTLAHLSGDLSRVEQLVNSTEADAWIIGSGSRDILEWFTEQEIPVFALFGRRHHLPIASTGPDKTPAMIEAIRNLVQQGHRRIVYLAHEDRRKPVPGMLESSFLRELEMQGIHTGSFNLPDWEDTKDGLHHCLDSLFKHTPPTALLVDTSPLFISVQQHLAQKGIVAPRDVSLICLDPDSSFAWCEPTIAHINWSPQKCIQRVTRWATNVSQGKEDLQETSSKAEYVDGGTVSPILAAI